MAASEATRTLEAEIAHLRERLALAETVCVLFGWTGCHFETDREKALHEVWSEWANSSGVSLLPGDHPELSDERIAELARQRDETRRRTLARHGISDAEQS